MLRGAPDGAHLEATLGQIMGRSPKKAKLEEETLLSHLEELAQGLDVEVRYEPMRREGPTFPGGLCKLKGKYVLIIDTKAATWEKIQALARGLHRFDLGQVYLRPGVREFLDKMTNQDPPP